MSVHPEAEYDNIKKRNYQKKNCFSLYVAKTLTPTFAPWDYFAATSWLLVIAFWLRNSFLLTIWNKGGAGYLYTAYIQQYWQTV